MAECMRRIWCKALVHKWQDMGFKLNEIMHDLEKFEIKFSSSIFLGQAVLETGFRVHDISRS